jgi:hypothetical protein
MAHRLAKAAAATAVLALGVATPAPAASSEGGRGYELVSTGDTNGTDVQNPLKFSPDGSRVAWVSLGAYADPAGANAELPYIATHGSGGWSVDAFAPRSSGTNRPGLLGLLGGYVMSDRMDDVLVVSAESLDPADQDQDGPFGSDDMYLVDSDGTAEWISRNAGGPPTNEPIDAAILARSKDGSAVFFKSSEHLTPAVPTGATGAQLYRWTRGGGLEALSLDETASYLLTGSYLGGDGSLSFSSGGQAGDLPDMEAMSADGSAFVFGGSGGVHGGASGPFGSNQVYLHRDGAATALVSEDQRTVGGGGVAPSGAVFLTSVSDLGIVYFRSPDPLTDDAPATGGDYRYDVATGKVTFSNPDESAASPFVLAGLSRVSADGSIIYFVDSQVLDDEAVPGSPNLYARSAGATRFIATLTDGISVDYGVAIAPSGNASPGQRWTPTGLSADGTRLVFRGHVDLPGQSTSATAQVFLYDLAADTTRCISCKPGAAEPTADATIVSEFDYRLPTPPVISADGSRVLFATGESLVAADTNGVKDVYEYVDGKAMLVSTGTSPAPSSLIGLSSDGVHAMFTTRSSLAPDDGDHGLIDIYDARIGAATSAPHAAGPDACSGDGCQGPPAPRPIVPESGSTLLAALPQAGESVVRRPLALLPISAAAAAKASKTGKLRFSVRLPQAGALRVAVQSRSGKTSTVLARKSLKAGRAGTVSVTLALGRTARQRLRALGSLQLMVSAEFAGQYRTRSVLLRVTTKGKARS